MKKYLVIVPGYPSNENKYNNSFVHSRVKEYLNHGVNVEVFSLSGKTMNYQYEDVNIECGFQEELIEKISNNCYEKILIHFCNKTIIDCIKKANFHGKLLIWVHGYEALGWYRRLYNFQLRHPRAFMTYIIENVKQMKFMNSFIKDNSINKKFIFVSNWMKDILEKDSFSKVCDYEIIPNVINEKQYPYKRKNKSDRLNILSIRPYASKKYANDLMVKAIVLLSKKSYFKRFNFEIYGDGELFDKTLKPLKRYSNVKIYKKFLNAEMIKECHSRNGIMLIPTRQDAQGVSMCEAMSSGLVPITSNNTAIPEYVKTTNGFLTNNPKEIVEAIDFLYNNPEEFLKMSERASHDILNKCSINQTIFKEISLIKEEENEG